MGSTDSGVLAPNLDVRRLGLIVLVLVLVIATGLLVRNVSGSSAEGGAATGADGNPAADTSGEGSLSGPGAHGSGDRDADADPASSSERMLAAALDDVTSPSLVAISTTGGVDTEARLDATSVPGVVAGATFLGETLPLVATADADGTTVDGDLPDGWRFPVEVLAVDPEHYLDVLPVPEVGSIEPGQGVLSESSATVRELGPGATMSFEDGTDITVTAVLPDELVGAAELLVSTDGPLEVGTPRFVLLRLDETVVDAEAGGADTAVISALQAIATDRGSVDRGDEVPVLRHAAGVMAQSRKKLHFGEFALTDGPGRWVRQGSTWMREHYAEATVPLLGFTECHEEMFPPLEAAMQDLVDRGLGHLIDGDDYGGCWAPRTSRGERMSSHAWGIAVDLNVAGNHYGAEPTIDPRVVEVMAEHGFAWGGDWPVPDGMHFELVLDR